MAYEAVVPNQPRVSSPTLHDVDGWLVRDLRATHPLYSANWAEWSFLTASYEGTKQLVELGVVKQHEREDTSTYVRRMSELHGFNFSKVVVDLVNFFLFKREPKRTIPEAIAEDPSWKMFLNDCNRYGDSFADYMADQGRWAAVMGYTGFLVDKPPYAAQNRAEEVKRGIYPYVSGYNPLAILDWTFERDETGKPVLTYLKLKDDTEDDDTYRLWWQDRWEVWQEPRTDSGLPLAGEEQGILLASGDNPLGEIPFVWMYNIHGRKRPIGVSDIHEIARIDLSVIRDLSQISEIVGYSAFPMLLAPMLAADDQTGQDDVGPTVVWEFNPETPQAKPEWLIPASEGVLEAIWRGIDRKAKEVYRIAHTGGLQATRAPSVAVSGTAMAAEFQQLNAVIVQKAANIETAENQIVDYWLRWQGLEKYADETQIVRSRDYDVHNLQQDLANALTAKTIVPSMTFKNEVSKSVARAVLPNLNDTTLQTIDEEIEESKQPEVPDEFLTPKLRPDEEINGVEEPEEPEEDAE